MNRTVPFPPDNWADDFARYLIHDRLEIVSILRTLQNRRAQVSLSWGEDQFSLSILLAVNPEFEEMVFDCGADPVANQALLRAENISLVANIEGIRVQFNARRAEATLYEGLPALRMRLPEIALRLQRRDSFRVPVSLICQLAIGQPAGVRALELRVADLSLSGIALVCDKSYVQFECGQVLENAFIQLGTVGTLAVNLQVRNLSQSTTRKGMPQQRIGCQFAAFSRSMEALISRYIAQKEREQIALV